MGKKGNWFKAIKKVFSSSSKEKQPPTGSEKKNSKEKKKSRGMLKNGENKSFIPIFREPSSIEKILGEVDQQKLFVRSDAVVSSELTLGLTSPPRVTSPRLPSPRTVASPRAVSPKVAASPRSSSQRISSPRVAAPPPPVRVPSPRAASPAITQSRREVNYVFRPEPTLRNQHLSATKIQAAYRGYMARRSFRALKGLVRLQGVLRSQNVKRQTVNAMKQMQLLVRVQNQIQSRRIQMLENQALQRQSHRNDKDIESTLSKWTLNQISEAGTEDWDDSLLTKDEVEVRLRKKVEAVIKRERAMAYAYSHQLWKSNPKSALDFRSNGFPWWWNWLERQLPSGANPSENQSAAAPTSATPKSVQLTPPRAVSEHKPSPSPRLLQASNSYYRNMIDNHESTTPKSSKSTTIGVRSSKQQPFHNNNTPLRTPTRTRTPQNNINGNNNNNNSTTNTTMYSSSSGLMKYSRVRTSTNIAHSGFNTTPLNDETDSLVSCPPFSSVPNYMAPTVSAKAKVRSSSNPKERMVPGTPAAAAAAGGDSKRRFSFPLTPNIASFKWNKGSNKDNNHHNQNSTSSHKILEKHESMRSIGEISVDSAVSMPAIVGRKPFNRFV